MKRIFKSLGGLLICCAIIYFALQGLHRLRNADGDSPPHGYPDSRYFSNGNFVDLAIKLGFERPIDWNPEIPPNIREWKNIEYRSIDGRSLLLDLYSPRALSGPAPALIFVHGGYWQRGKRADYSHYAVAFAMRGYVTATIDYRPSSEAIFPAAVIDVKCCVKWIRANAAAYSIDPAHLALIGGSAGGHLAMMAAYSPDSLFVDRECPHDSVSSAVQAVVDLYAPVDLTTQFMRTDSMVQRFIGRGYDEDPAGYERASPKVYISSDAPPTLIMHGIMDANIPVTQSDSLRKWLDAAGVDNVYYRIPGWAHTMDGIRSMNRYALRSIDVFLHTYLPAAD